MLSAKKAGQRTLIVSGGEDSERYRKVVDFYHCQSIVKMRLGMFEVKYQPKVDQCSLGAHSVDESWTH